MDSILASVYKVSIVIPTYKTAPEGLKRLLKSLDAQTLSADDFEIIFVDDGSPDDTFERLQSEKVKRSNVSVTRIENSGWPSKPRNVGIKMAKGEYVLFMDHDDELYPDALRAGYEFAMRNNADVLSGKESRTDNPSWAVDVYREDQPQALDGEGPHALIPMNPHKLYRRQLLRKHKIRFTEGRLVLWEDVMFNIEVAQHAEVISRMASVPFYHWITVEGSGTSQFDKDSKHYWQMLREVCESAVKHLSGPGLENQREQILRTQYSARVLGAFNVGFLKRSKDSRRMIFAESRQIREDFGLERFDETLSVSVALRAALLGQGRLDLLERLCEEDVTIAGWGTTESVSWDHGILNIEAGVEWTSAHGRRLSLGRRHERISKVLSPELESVFSAEQLSMTNEIAGATGDVAVRSRSSKLTYLADTTWSTSVSDETDGLPVLCGRLRAAIDPAKMAFGTELDDEYWDVQLRIALGSAVTHRGVRSSIATSLTITDGQLHVVYPNDGGTATLVPRGQQEAIRRLTPTRASFDADGLIQVDLAGVHDGEGEVTCTIGLDTSTSANKNTFTGHPAILRVSEGRASLHFRRTGSVMRMRIGDHAGLRPPFWTLFITEDGVGMNVGQLPKIRTTAEYEHENQAG